MSKKIATRIIQKHDLEVNWLNAAGFIPMRGELIIYDSEIDADGSVLDHPADRDPYDYARFKIGDGLTSVNELPFALDNHTHTASQITDVEWMATRVPTESTILLQETTVSSSIVNGVTTPLQEGAQYVVYWNGEAFHQVAKIEDGTEYLGNLSCLTSTGSTTYEDTGEPFFIQQLNNSFLVYRKDETDSSPILKVVLLEDLPRKLPSEFLVDHTHVVSEITDAEWIATSDTASATVVVPKKTTSTSSATTSFITADSPSFITGVTYKVEWDDTCYYLTPVVKGTTNCLGNLYLIDNTKPDTGEPFCVQPGGMATKVAVADYSVVHTIKILLDTSVKMPARFLPDSLTAQLTEMLTEIDSKADSNHTHTKEQITNFPSSMRNPYPLIINGASYTGATEVSVNTPKAFYITVTNDGSGNYSSDKTLKEIVSAYRSNNSLFVLYNEKILHPDRISIVDVPDVSGAVTAALRFTNDEHSQSNTIIYDTCIVDLNGDYYMDNEDLNVFVTTNTYEMQTQQSVQVIVESKFDGMYEYIDKKADISHTHTIANITNLQSTLDGKAAASHGTHVSYSTTAPVMDGSASVGTASTVARSDHKHPTDTSRAAQSSLDSHTSNKSNPHGVTATQVKALPMAGGTMDDGATIKLSTYGNRFLTISGNSINADMSNTTGGWAGSFASVKDPTGDSTTMLGWYGGVSGLTHIFMGGTYSDPAMKMTKNGQFTFKNVPNVGTDALALAKDIPTMPTIPNGFSNIKVGSTTVAADTTTDTVEFAGSNVSITSDATNDKITFTVADGTTSTKGVVQLTNSTSSTSTTTAATPSSVKSAYDLANTAKTNAATAQARADAAYTLANGKAGSLSDLGITATAAELNYVDGVTSNIQTQLNGKAASSHGTHVSYGTSSSALGTSSAGSATTVSRSDHVHALPALTSCTGTLTVAKGGTGYTSIVDTTYTTARYRASSLHSSTTSPTSNGAIAWTYE